MARLQGKVALVTGASKGIGAGIALALAEEGAAITVNYSSDRTGAERVVNAIKSKGGKAIAVAGSVAQASDVERIFEATENQLGNPDILVNNAGVYAFSPLETFDESEFHRQFNTNVLGLLASSKRALKSFGEAGGSIINIGSVVSRAVMAGASVYAATKGSVDVITKVLAKELGPKKIRVNSINPGAVETEGTKALAGFETLAQNFIPQTPLGRLGQPDDIAAVAVFLASEDSRWITGQLIEVSGGF